MTVTLAGDVVVVTGGGGGIGSAICLACARAGATVILTYNRDGDRAAQLAASLPGSGHLVVQAPAESSDALARLADQIAARHPRVDLLVNNAGFSRQIPLDDLDALDDALIDELFRVNWRGAFATVRALRPLLAASDHGMIINMSSVAGTIGYGSNIAYCATKAALDSLTRSLARALAPGIRVVSIAPGMVEGEYTSRFAPAMLATQRAHTPLGRIATNDDVAQAVIAATQLRFTTGVILPVDGGRPLGS